MRVSDVLRSIRGIVDVFAPYIRMFFVKSVEFFMSSPFYIRMFLVKYVVPGIVNVVTPFFFSRAPFSGSKYSSGHPNLRAPRIRAFGPYER